MTSPGDLGASGGSFFGGLADPTAAVGATGGGSSFLSSLGNLFGSGGGIQSALGSSLVGSLTGGGAINAALAYQNGQNASQQLTNLSNLTMQRADPFAPQRGQYQSILSGMFQDPSSFIQKYAQPGFDLASEAAMRSGAASGSFASSTTAGDLTKLGQDYASSTLQNYGSLLGNLSGANINPGAGVGAAANAATAGITTNMNSINNLTSALAQASKPQTTINQSTGQQSSGSDSSLLGSAIKGITSLFG